MANTKYNRGVALERFIKRALEANGYYVMRSAGSKGIADLIAINHLELLFIQAKTTKFKPILTEENIRILQHFRFNYSGFKKYLVVKVAGSRPYALYWDSDSSKWVNDDMLTRLFNDYQHQVHSGSVGQKRDADGIK